MIYKSFKDKKLSALGMGCMRFPLCEGTEQVDIATTRAMISYAIEHGINYFDTAWVYHNGNSETILGDILSEYPRERFYLATKFPGFDRESMGKVEEIFEKQLQKCKVDYFDFYLFHNVCETNIDGYLNEENRILEYLVEQKKKGRISHLGFSTHGSLAVMRRFLDTCGNNIEFCQIQLNWLDWKLQDAKAKVELLGEYNIPIWVMEPVRGGKLATLAPEYENTLKKLRPEASSVEWAFRFLQTIPNIAVTLSGMSNFEQLRENIATYEAEKPLGDTELKALFEVASAMTAEKTLPCTACKYCTSYCPVELDIPTIIRLYNDHVYSGGGFLAPMAFKAFPEGKKPWDCLSCRACESVCPQNILISEMMSDFSERLKK